MSYRNRVLASLDKAAERIAVAKKSMLTQPEGGSGVDVWSCWCGLVDAQDQITCVMAELLDSCGEPKK